MHSQNYSYKQHHTTHKPVTYSKSIVHLSKVSFYVNEHISAIKKKVFASLFTNKIVKILSHVVNITVHSVSIIWCKLWKQFGWQLLTWKAESSTSHVCHTSFQSTNLHITLCGIWLKESVSKRLNYWGYGRSPIFSRTLQLLKAMNETWSTTVALISSDMRLCSWLLLPLPQFWLCTLPPCILTPLLPLVCWSWSFSGCSSTVRICYSCVFLCLYMLPRQEIHEMQLWAISEN